MDSNEPAWWQAVAVGRGADRWGWGSEIELPAGTPLALTLHWSPTLVVAPGTLGLELCQVAPGVVDRHF